jgi:elongation factor Ts
MSEITASDVKALRERSGAGMMDCKKALVECDGDIEKAVDYLRKKGLSTAAKKASRVAAEGLIGVHVDGTKGTIVEVNAETDFVARNETFQAFVKKIVEIASAKNCDLKTLKTADYGNGHTVSEETVNLIATIRENIELRRVSYMTVDNGIVASYVHNKISDGLGKIGVLVGIESTGDKAKLMELGKQIAMHIAAANPLSTSVDDLDPAVVERERAVVTEQAKNSGKKPEFVDKIVEGRLRKFYEDAVLLEQVFVIDGETRVKDVVAAASKELGTPVKVKGFYKFVLGEGIEKQVVDFAAEVAAQLS